MSKFYITLNEPDVYITDLSKVAGVVEILPTPEGKICEELIKNGNFCLSPYGYVKTEEENVEVKNFELMGFSIKLKED